MCSKVESIRKKDNKKNKNEDQSGSMESDINELWKEFDDDWEWKLSRYITFKRKSIISDIEIESGNKRWMNNEEDVVFYNYF